MNSISSLCLVLALSFCVYQIQPVESASLVTKACSTARYKGVCEKTLQADPSSASADMSGLLAIALKATSGKLKSIQSQIASQLQSTSDKFTKQALSDCSEGYDTAAGLIQDSIGAAKSKRYNDVNTWVSSAMSNADSCEDGFRPGTANKLSKANEEFGQLCSSVLAVSNQA